MGELEKILRDIKQETLGMEVTMQPNIKLRCWDIKKHEIPICSIGYNEIGDVTYMTDKMYPYNKQAVLNLLKDK